MFVPLFILNKQNMKPKKRNLLQFTLSLFICLFISSFAFAQGNSDAKLGIFEFEKVLIDYGTINKNDDGNRVFTFVNKGNAPIIISGIKSSCGCTVPSFSKQPIVPGEKGEIKVKYATSRVGPFSKTITVLSNANEAQKQLKIKGKILNNTSI